MDLNKITLFILLSLPGLFSLSWNETTVLPDLVQGKLVDSVSGAPISNAYIYIVSGEEEALSSNHGSFQIMTWQSFPITIHILHDRYRDSKIVYRKASDSHVIKLQRK